VAGGGTTTLSHPIFSPYGVGVLEPRLVLAAVVMIGEEVIMEVDSVSCGS